MSNLNSFRSRELKNHHGMRFHLIIDLCWSIIAANHFVKGEAREKKTEKDENHYVELKKQKKRPLVIPPMENERRERESSIKYVQFIWRCLFPFDLF